MIAIRAGSPPQRCVQKRTHPTGLGKKRYFRGNAAGALAPHHQEISGILIITIYLLTKLKLMLK
jgi:hypothetical protein